MFSKKEIDYLKGNINPNHNYAKTLRKRINRKIRELLNDDIPLLKENEHTRHWISALGVLTNLRGTENSTRGTEFSTPIKNKLIDEQVNKIIVAPGVGLSARYSRAFEPTGPCGHRLSRPAPYQARRPRHRIISLRRVGKVMF